MHKKQCRQCHKTFQVDQWDLNFYQQLDLPVPTLCPDCRQQRRLAVSNQLFLYNTTCAATAQSIISNYHPADGYVVYDQSYWHSDAWDPMSYGKNFDFSKSFFEQYYDFAKIIPRPNLLNGHEYDENSPYTNHAGKNKNCYMIFDSDINEDCYYSYSVNSCKQCLDCYRVRKSELCYECIDCENCYASWYLQDCKGCLQSVLLKDCVDVKNSIMCVGLRHKQYRILNKPVTPDEYQIMLKKLNDRAGIEALRKQFKNFCLKFPNKFIHGTHNETVVGDYLNNCKQAMVCYDSNDLENCKYFYQAFDSAKDSMDCQEVGDKAELVYDSTTLGYTVYNCQFSYHALGNLVNLQYCQYCFRNQNLFGCFALRNKQFCIFNKQYTEEQYYELKAKIIQHMIDTGEWGQFWPMRYAWFPYNETLAQDYFPLTEEQAKAQDLRWRQQPTVAATKTQVSPPQAVSAILAGLSKQIFQCCQCGKDYKIIAQELAIYQVARMPLPNHCFMCRHRNRLAHRNPRSLWQRQCMCTQTDHAHSGRCTETFATSYAPDHKEMVYCESCYQKEIY